MSEPPPRGDARTLWAWSFFDFANSAFTTLIITFVYATFFVKGIAETETAGTVWWTWGVLTPSAALVAILSPLLGALADRTGTRKRALMTTTLVCVGATALLFFPQRGDVVMAVVLVAIANVAFELGQVFYNAFLPEIAPPEKIGRVSGWGWALGYAGGLLCLVLALVVFIQPETAPFGLDKATGEHVRVTNVLVAVWFALFALPALLVLREPKAEGGAPRGLVRATFGELRETARHLGRYRQIVRLLIARLFYNDGIVTIFSLGGIFAVTAYGFTADEVIVFGIALNVAAGLGAFAFSFLDDAIGGKRTIFISLALLVVATVVAVVGPTKAWLWGAGLMVGLAAGPNQAASRSLLGRFVPPDKETEFYGFFAFSGKATAFVGPAMFGLLTAAFGTQRAGVAFVLVLFALGAVVLARVDEADGILRSGRTGGDLSDLDPLATA